MLSRGLMERRWRQGMGHGGFFFLCLLITATPVLPSSQDLGIRAFRVGEPVPNLD